MRNLCLCRKIRKERRANLLRIIFQCYFLPFPFSRLGRPILDFASQYAAFCQQKFPSLLPGEALGNMQIFPFLFLLLSRRQSRQGGERFFWVRLRRVGRAQAAFEMTHLSCKKLFLSSSPLFPSSLSCSSCWTLACSATAFFLQEWRVTISTLAKVIFPKLLQIWH